MLQKVTNKFSNFKPTIPDYEILIPLSQTQGQSQLAKMNMSYPLTQTQKGHDFAGNYG